MPPVWLKSSGTLTLMCTTAVCHCCRGRSDRRATSFRQVRVPLLLPLSGENLSARHRQQLRGSHLLLQIPVYTLPGEQGLFKKAADGTFERQAANDPIYQCSVLEGDISESYCKRNAPNWSPSQLWCTYPDGDAMARNAVEVVMAKPSARNK
mmetsp:Transcript_37138/g.116887  ORF Transcript_37138/g.116887 Transcript_37138/m.116887 type:complete len:152 (+) Transcript_37138:190-645(+)